ncbi:unnamed protein product [Paramecium octaurelia]|uniref:Uncharacterized protein n=1 Tax=Paramecium octaurelia TaxID=43137 RepID=A0A8S1U7V2_PAROT|nr:unnamed protein product [Paramecium octaurelia]
MDIKIQTQSSTFLIYIENFTIQDLKWKLKRLGIELKDIVIYFYDNDGDKIVIIDDKDVEYGYQQGNLKIRNRIKFYIYYKLKQPRINIIQNHIQDHKELTISDGSEQIQKSNNSIIDLPCFPGVEKREDRLKQMIENYIDTLLREQYEI